MKYAEMDWGRMEAVVNKLGGMDGVRRFLSGELTVKALELLELVRVVAVSGTHRFVAADAFGPDNPAGIKFFLAGGFQEHLLGKVEEGVEPATIAVHRLKYPSRDPEIMAELGVKGRVIKLTHFYELIKAQARGQEGPLVVDGYTNVAYIADGNGNPWAVNADRHASDYDWRVFAKPINHSGVWCGGVQFLSQVQV